MQLGVGGGSFGWVSKMGGWTPAKEGERKGGQCWDGTMLSWEAAG